MNYIFIFILVIVFLGQHLPSFKPYLKYFILSEWSVSGLLGHMWLHHDFLHLAANLLFLWVFGNALCGSIGNFWYLLIYPACGLLAGMGYLALDGHPAVGASGAISGIIVAICVLFPYRRVYTSILLLVFPVFRFSLMGLWYLIIKFFYELLFSLIGGGRVAYAAHLSGIIGGGLLAYILMKLNFLTGEHSGKDLIRSLNTSTDTDF